MDYATTDLVLAIVHHLLVFMLAGVLAFEIGAMPLTMKRDEILGVGRVDNWYGILALVIVVVGFIRATVAAKGWPITRSTYFSGRRSSPSSSSACPLKPDSGDFSQRVHRCGSLHALRGTLCATAFASSVAGSTLNPATGVATFAAGYRHTDAHRLSPRWSGNIPAWLLR